MQNGGIASGVCQIIVEKYKAVYIERKDYHYQNHAELIWTSE